jgi:predicted RNA binding protein YcfA (HicA-like mRNA interferase family)
LATRPRAAPSLDRRHCSPHDLGMKPTRVWQAILDGNLNIRFGDFERLLAAFGFVLDRQTGSHRIWYHPKLRERMNVQPMGGKAKPYQVRQLVQLVEAAGLTLDD